MSSPDPLTTRAHGYTGPDRGTVDIWWANLDDLRPAHWSLLDPREADRADGYLRDEDRDRFVLGVALSRTVLAAALGRARRDVPLVRECADCGRPHGRPRLGPAAHDLDFSLSHSAEVLALAVSDSARVGIDVELIADAPDLSSVARNVLSVDELTDSLGPGGSFDAGRFFDYWVRKESLLKATGDGLAVPMHDVRVPGVGSADVGAGICSRPELIASVQRLNAPEGYAAALSALQAAPPSVRVFGLPAMRITRG